MRPLKILYVGPDYPGSNGTCWRDAFRELGHDVSTVATEQSVPARLALVHAVRQKLMGRPPRDEVRRLNDAVVRAVRAVEPSFTFYIQARHILPETLEETSRYGPSFVYMNDDMFNPRNQFFTFYDAVPRMDCILTTKSYNVAEFEAAGAPLALFIPNAYDPTIHFPAKLSVDERLQYEGDIAFIGTFRSERADFLWRVAAETADCRLNIWGGGWHKMARPFYWPKRYAWRQVAASVRGTELWCAEMGKAIQANRICLGLLNRANRDLHTSRSFEIPACGGFLLAERTDEHGMYFTEDREAVYFESLEELVDKARYYLSHDEARRRIAKAGYERCRRSAYRYVDRAAFAIEQAERLRKDRPAGSLTRRGARVYG